MDAEEQHNDGTKLRYVRAAIESARAGIAHIRKQKAASWLALFFGYGLLANVRAVWDTLDKREAAESDAHKQAILEWKQGYSKNKDRNYQLLRVARNSLLKDLKAVPIPSWHWSSGESQKSYDLAIYIPKTKESELVLTPEEREERDIASSFIQADGGDASMNNTRIRIDLIREAEAALSAWELEVEKIEARIGEIRASQIE